MAVTTIPESMDLNNKTDWHVIRNTQFSHRWPIKLTGGGTVIANVILLNPEDLDPGVSFVSGGAYSGLSGKYTNQFEDKFYVIDKGSATNLDDDYNFDPLSDSHVAPTVVTGTGLVPPNKDIVAIKNDQTAYVTKQYNLLVQYRTGGSEELSQETITVEQIVYNDFNVLINWIKEYQIA
jgi:hypothetical protein